MRAKGSVQSRGTCKVCGKRATATVCSACADKIRAEAVSEKLKEYEGKRAE